MGCMELYGDAFEICPHCGYIEGTQAEEAIHMEPGTLLHDRYIIGRVLGFGGFGVTYIGWDGKLEQKVAVKEYLPGEFSTRMPGQSCVTVFNGDKSEQFRDGMNKFVEEAKRLAKFQNEPGIVKVFDSFTENETAYIVMEYLDGETLTERLKRDKTIPEDEAVKMLWQVMDSLQTVHKEGILHRDIAPDNIFLTKSGDVKLIDFGASRYATTSHSRSLTVIIKPGYSPEEQYRSRGDQGPYTDVYALAATLYKMITGKTPPDAMERRAKIENQKREILEEPHKLNKNISVNRENAILNAMNVRIEDRTPDVATFMSELEADPPAKRRYGKIKKIDIYAWPLWLKILLSAALAVMVVFGVLLGTGIIRFPSLYSDTVVVPDGVVIVPDVEGMDKDEAMKLLTDSKLVPSPDGNVESAYVEAGKIVLQSPTGGSYQDENGTVTLSVSSGTGVVQVENGVATVPYVVWDEQDAAVSKLKSAGLAEPIIKTQSDEHVAAGKVISQSVEAGTEVNEGTQITIVVSTGAASFNMPNVVGMTEANAKKQLSGKGLNVTVQYAKNDQVAEGKVISQSVKSGAAVQKGTAVTLTVSSGKPTVSVPNVVGKARAAAVSALEQSGFKVTVLENYHATVESGNVISQSPVSGTMQIKGSTVTIYVSKGKQSFTVPDVYGKTASAAQSALGHFKVEVKYGGYSASVPYGCVLSQSPAANTSLTDGSTVTLTLSKGPDWSTWSEVSPNVDAAQYDIQRETRYRYRDKQTTTSTNGSLGNGWIKTGSTNSYGNWSDKGWTSSKPGESDTLRITNTKTVTDRAGYTQYNLYYYRYWNSNTNSYYYTYSPQYGGTRYTISVTLGEITRYGNFSGWDGYTLNDRNKRKFSNELWFIDSTTDIPAVTHTEWYYQTRSKTVNYQYYKWGDWSGYSANGVSANENRQVETKTYYRYRRK